MDMNDQDESRNVDDVRGSSGGGGFRPVHGVGLGTIVIALVAGWFFNVNPLQILSLLSGGAPTTRERSRPSPCRSPVATPA